MSTGLGSSRRRERVLLGLDQAFASSSSTTAASSSAAGRAGGTGGAGAGAGQAGGKPASNDAALYTELPVQILTSTTTEAASDKPAPPTTVESALQDLLLRNTRDLQLKGKTVTLDNTRGQNEQQRKEARLRRQLLRGRTRFSVSIAEEGGGRGGGAAAATGVGGKEADDDNGGSPRRKMKRKRQVASYQDYVALEGAWEGYMQQLLGVRTEKEEEGEEGRVGEDKTNNDKPEPRISNAKPAFYSKKSAERNVAGADMHGARVRVVASKCPSEVGLEGIVVRESRWAFHILPISDTLGERRRVKIVPKAGRRFQATLEGGRGRAEGREGQKKKLTLILHGNGLVDRGRAIASPLMMRRDKAGGGGEAGRLLKTTHLM